MGYYTKQEDTGRVTLNDLRNQLYFLNRQMLLALQCHDDAVQGKIQGQIAAVQAQIDHMCLEHSC